jgi:hypothetical protein
MTFSELWLALVTKKFFVIKNIIIWKGCIFMTICYDNMLLSYK